MSFSPESLDAAKQKIHTKNEKAKQKAYKRLTEVYVKAPKIKDIDDKLNSICYSLTNAIISGKNVKAKMIAFKDEALDLKAERAELLTSLGLPIDYTETVFSCKKCEDTGNADGYMCSCLKRELYAEEFNRSKLGGAFKSLSFKGFSLDYYSDKTNNMGYSPKEKMQKILEYAKNYSGKKFGENILLRGATGLGKTFLSACIAKDVIESGKSVVYDTAPSIFRAFEEEKFKNIKNDTEKYLNCDLLIIDDLGSEFVTPFIQSVLFDIINTRYIDGQPTIINTNLTTDEIQDQYSDKVASRILGNFNIFSFEGEDIRQQKRKQK